MEDWNDTYTLLYVKYITNKDLLDRIDSSTQYSIMTYIWTESKKKKKKRVGICICITDSLCSTPETNTIKLKKKNNFFKCNVRNIGSVGNFQLTLQLIKIWTLI